MTGKLDLEVVAVDAPEKVVRGADIVATCTDSTRTVFDEPEWLKEGAHITCVRACEVGPKVIQQCDLSVKLGKNTIEAMDEGMVRLHGNVGYIAGQPEERSRIPIRRWIIIEAIISSTSWMFVPARCPAEPMINK